MSASGVRVARRQETLEPREHYENLVAQNYADQGHVKFAELVEAGHVCSACHITRQTNGIPDDDQVDLDQYTTVAALAKAAETAVELAADFGIGLAVGVEARLAKTVTRLHVAGLGTTELDAITLRQIGEEILANPVASRSYTQLQNYGTEIVLDFKPAPIGVRDLGVAVPVENRILVYVQKHQSPREVVSTLVHESSHIHRRFRGNRIDRLDEVRAWSREFLHRMGRRPTAQERRDIWDMVVREYTWLEH